MHMHVAAELHMLCRSAYARRRRSHRRRRRRRHAGNALCYVDAGSDVALRSCCCCCVGERRREYVCESTKCMCMCECSSSSSSRARTSQQTHIHTHTCTLAYFCLSALPCCAVLPPSTSTSAGGVASSLVKTFSTSQRSRLRATPAISLS